VALVTLASKVTTARGTLTATGWPLAVNCTVWFCTTIVVGPPASPIGAKALLNQMQLPAAIGALLKPACIDDAGHGRGVAVGVGVRVEVRVADGVRVRVAVLVGVRVAVLVRVRVAVLVRVANPPTAVPVAVLVGMCVAVFVGADVSVGELVAV
jgi:hypothetical protein